MIGGDDARWQHVVRANDGANRDQTTSFKPGPGARQDYGKPGPLLIALGSATKPGVPLLYAVVCGRLAGFPTLPSLFVCEWVEREASGKVQEDGGLRCSRVQLRTGKGEKRREGSSRAG